MVITESRGCCGVVDIYGLYYFNADDVRKVVNELAQRAAATFTDASTSKVIPKFGELLAGELKKRHFKVTCKYLGRNPNSNNYLYMWTVTHTAKSKKS